jgi:hypothetical protein
VLDPSPAADRTEIRATSYRRFADFAYTSFAQTGDYQDLSEAIYLLRLSLVVCPSSLPEFQRSCGDLISALQQRSKIIGDHRILLEASTLGRLSLALCSRNFSLCRTLSSALHKEYEKSNNQRFLVETISLDRALLAYCPLGQPNHTMEELYRNLSLLLYRLFQRTHDQEPLKESIESRRRSLALCPEDHADRAENGQCLLEALRWRFKLTHDRRLLPEIITLEREQLRLCSSDHPQYKALCWKLSLSLYRHFKYTGDQQLLTETIDLRLTLLALYPENHPDRAKLYGSLSVSLRQRFKYNGDRQTLMKAIDVDRLFLTLCPEGHADRMEVCGHLSASLYEGFRHTGDQQLLTEIIKLEREVLSLCFKGHPDRAVSCKALAFSLHMRYKRTGDRDTLIEAIALQEEALSLVHHEHENRASFCSNLANLLYSCYKHTGNDLVLTQATDLMQQALSLSPYGHPDRVAPCSSLAVLLHEQYKNTGDLGLLSKIIDLMREAHILCPIGHPAYASSRENLAFALQTFYKSTGGGDNRILDEIVQLHHESLLVVPPHEAWRHLTALSRVYLEANNRHHDIKKAIECLYNSLEFEFHDIFEAVGEILTCLNAVWRFREDHGLQLRVISLTGSYQRLARFLPLLVNPALDMQTQLQLLRNCRNVGPDAFVDAVLRMNWKSGVEIMELTQGLLWRQRLHYCDPQLSDIPPHLAVELQQLLKAIASTHSSPLHDDPTISSGSLTAWDIHHDNSARIHALIREIRLLPGLDRFMLGDPYHTLCAVSFAHPVVLLAGARSRYYAVIMTSSSPQDHSLLPLDLCSEDFEQSLSIHSSTRPHRGTVFEDSPEEEDPHERGMHIKRTRNTCLLQHQLQFIWIKIVKPILDHLGLQVSIRLHLLLYHILIL